MDEISPEKSDKDSDGENKFSRKGADTAVKGVGKGMGKGEGALLEKSGNTQKKDYSFINIFMR